MKTSSILEDGVGHGDYRKVLSDLHGHLIFTSPPYNIGSEGIRRDGQRRFGRYDPKSYGGIRDYADEFEEATYQDSQADFLVWAADHLHANGTLVYNHKCRRQGRLLHPAEWFLRKEVRDRLTLMEEIVWDRRSTHNHSDRLMWPVTERLYVFKRTDGDYRFKNTAALPQRSDLWSIVREYGSAHAAPFPLALARAVVLAWSQPGELVLDPYAGSGTTGVAALALGRRFRGAEIKKKYARLAWARLTAA